MPGMPLQKGPFKRIRVGFVGSPTAINLWHFRPHRPLLAAWTYPGRLPGSEFPPFLHVHVV